MNLRRRTDDTWTSAAHGTAPGVRRVPEEVFEHRRKPGWNVAEIEAQFRRYSASTSPKLNWGAAAFLFLRWAGRFGRSPDVCFRARRGCFGSAFALCRVAKGRQIWGFEGFCALSARSAHPALPVILFRNRSDGVTARSTRRKRLAHCAAELPFSMRYAILSQLF